MSTPRRSFNDPYESWIEKAKRKFNENPWVPIGCLATCGALVMSAVTMRQGKSQHMNYWMRARVALQGLTLVALVGGSMALQKQRELEGPAAAEEDALREKEEFAERLRAAEEVVAMEQDAGISGSQTVRGPAVNRDEEHRRLSEQRAAAAQAGGATTEAVRKTNWKWWSSKSDSN